MDNKVLDVRACKSLALHNISYTQYCIAQDCFPPTVSQKAVHKVGHPARISTMTAFPGPTVKMTLRAVGGKR